ncbi:MAG: PAS domain S-box protein [Acidobacteria bacterium]|nr:PAS domain S-box protein [Acidobacteriota bacterium]
MRVFPGWNRLRVRLLVLLLLAFLPASALLVYNNFDRRRAETQHVGDQAMRLARLAARDQERLLAEANRMLSGLASQPDVRSGDPQRCGRRLAASVEHHPSYGNFLVANPAGAVICSGKAAPSINVSDRKYFQDAIRTRRFSIGNYQVGRITGRASLSFGLPILDESGAPEGVVAASLDLERFNQFGAQARLPANGTVLIVDSGQVVLARVPDADRWVGKRVPAGSALARHLNAADGSKDLEGLDGIRRLYGVSDVRVGDSRLAVAIGMPLDAIAEADRAFYGSLGLLGIMALFTLVLAWTAIEAFVVRPIDSLRAATRRLASGDLAGRAKFETGIEHLDSLGHDFDEMAQALQERETREKTVRDARDEAEEKYRQLVEQSLVGVYLVSASGIVYVNPRFAEIFGYTVDELQQMSLIELVHDSDRAMVARNVQRRARGEVTSVEYSFRGIRKDGSTVIVQVHGTMTTYRGQPALMGVMIDRTEQKRLEQQLQQAQKMEAVGRLAGGVAHDFNNLLTVITGYSEFLSQQLPESSLEREHVEEIRKAAESASNLTRQLLAFSRNQVMQPQVLNLNTVVSGFEKMIRRLIGEDIRIKLRLDPDMALVKVDPGQMEQVILNLAINARDAMPNGGTLTIETANTILDEQYVRRHRGAQPGPHVVLAVSDTGVGMSAETQSRVFDPFFTTKERDRGTGLGLATVYGIVKQSGGSIWLYSEEGRGTTFKIFLPVADDAAAAAAAAAAQRAEATTGSETILLVEDNVALRAWIAQALTQLGYSVIPLDSPTDALAISSSKDGPVHLLLTDVVMPKMNGPELAKRLTKRWPAIKVLFMSGYTNEAMVPHELLPPGQKVLQKPFASHALAQHVRSTLDARSAGAALPN